VNCHRCPCLNCHRCPCLSSSHRRGIAPLLPTLSWNRLGVAGRNLRTRSGVEGPELQRHLHADKAPLAEHEPFIVVAARGAVVSAYRPHRRDIRGAGDALERRDTRTPPLLLRSRLLPLFLEFKSSSRSTVVRFSGADASPTRASGGVGPSTCAVSIRKDTTRSESGISQGATTTDAAIRACRRGF
jgi:hypothetical protein